MLLLFLPFAGKPEADESDHLDLFAAEGAARFGAGEIHRAKGLPADLDRDADVTFESELQIAGMRGDLGRSGGVEMFDLIRQQGVHAISAIQVKTCPRCRCPIRPAAEQHLVLAIGNAADDAHRSAQRAAPQAQQGIDLFGKGQVGADRQKIKLAQRFVALGHPLPLRHLFAKIGQHIQAFPGIPGHPTAAQPCEGWHSFTARMWRHPSPAKYTLPACGE